ncbi:MAG: ATP-binding cassette domain-containing protein [Treponemataceae bacterium]|nr:ATP-binding cassette domain-containing protein [Treponemataceae bacterium]
MKMIPPEQPILSVRNLTKRFGPACPVCTDPHTERLEKNYCPLCGTVWALRDVQLDLYAGEILGIVGESGSGKSTLLSCLYFDQNPDSGSLFLSTYTEPDCNIFTLSSQAKRWIRNNCLGMVYQNPLLGLRMNISAISNIAEKLIAAGYRNVSIIENRSRALLEHVNIPFFRMKDSPQTFSGGMQQRLQIAKALSNNPPILFLDEVTTGLDLSVQANVLDLVKQLQRELGISMLIVSHDLAVIRMLADRAMVMLNGRVIESGLTDQILEDPHHPYTQQLVHSLL